MTPDDFYSKITKCIKGNDKVLKEFKERCVYVKGDYDPKANGYKGLAKAIEEFEKDIGDCSCVKNSNIVYIFILFHFL